MLRVLIVDDEELARIRLRGLLAQCDGTPTRLVGEAANATQALVLLATQPCDLLLLDIGMPGRDGLALAAELRAMTPAPAVVFVTAHAVHALRAFELDAADYLTKPVRRERLQAALLRVAQRLGQHPPAGEAPCLVVSDRGRVVRVPVDEVLYLKAELKYVTLRTREHSYLLDESLTDLQQRLGDRFLRVHRNALVCRTAVRELERRNLGAGAGAEDETGDNWAVRMAPLDEWLAVSRRQVVAVREALVLASSDRR